MHEKCISPPEFQPDLYTWHHQTRGVVLLENAASHDRAQHGALSFNVLKGHIEMIFRSLGK